LNKEKTAMFNKSEPLSSSDNEKFLLSDNTIKEKIVMGIPRCQTDTKASTTSPPLTPQKRFKPLHTLADAKINI